jgi:hypothetical protein
LAKSVDCLGHFHIPYLGIECDSSKARRRISSKPSPGWCLTISL